MDGIMGRRHINRNFTHPEALRPPAVTATSFEQIVKALKLSPQDYRNSFELKNWVFQNKDKRYIPPELLGAFGFQVDDDSGC